MRKPLVILSALILPAALMGCVTTTSLSAPTSAPFCQAAQPIRWSARDTDKTIEQVKEHNAVGRELCGWGRR